MLWEFTKEQNIFNGIIQMDQHAKAIDWLKPCYTYVYSYSYQFVKIVSNIVL